MNINITSRSTTKSPSSLHLLDSATVKDLKLAYYQLNHKYTCDRQRWSFDNKVLTDDQALLSSYNIKDGDTLTFKDLGPQIGWKTVFLIEYAGPLLIYPVFYNLGHLIYNNDYKLVHHSNEQVLVYYMLMFHFLKRELETLFVHRFSHGTMPFMNVFKNSFHYWILSGVLIAWHVFSPGSIPSTSDIYHAICIGIFMFGQVSNFITHWTLRNLRKPGSKERKIPHGYGFDLVSCPNYFFESVSWLSILLLTRSWTVALFLIVSVTQMYVWAIKKHKNYKKDFQNYPKHRKAIFPFIA